MIELSKHIECLLLRHNCVIVPGLGGFVTQYVPARYVPEEELFIPPFRSVGFNPRLTLNDGLLVQSYMQAYDTSYPETQRIVENAVAEVRAELQESGSFTFNGIGTLSLDAAGNYDFAPCEAGVLSPALYGLSSFTAQALEAPAECVKKEAPRRKRKMRVVKKSEKSYVFSINKELVNYVAAAVVHRDGVTDKGREYRAGTAPGLEDLLLAGLVELVDALEQFRSGERPFLNASAH